MFAMGKKRLGAVIAAALVVGILPTAPSAVAGTAGVAAQTRTLTVTIEGRGTVTDDRGQIDCYTGPSRPTKSPDCSGTYDVFCDGMECEFPTIRLTATPHSGRSFVSWGGACSDSTPTCDVFLNTNKTVSATFADLEPPTVSITNPSDGAKITGSRLIEASASDNVGVTEVAFHLGSSSGTLIGKDVNAPYSVTWDTSQVTEGDYPLVAVARDAAGHATSSAAVNVTVDNSLPTVEITKGPKSGAILAKRQVQFEVEFSGAWLVVCQLSGHEPAFGCPSPQSYSKLASRTYVFRASAEDEAGNGEQAQRIFTVAADNTELTHKKTWKRIKSKGAYGGTASVTKKKGAKLIASAGGSSALVATTCPTCGKVKVFVGDQLVKKVSLTSSKVMKKRLIKIGHQSYWGLVSVVVASKGKPVIIEGLGVHDDD